MRVTIELLRCGITSRTASYHVYVVSLCIVLSRAYRPVSRLYNDMTLHNILTLRYLQLSDDAEEAQEEVRVAARAAAIAPEKAAQEVAQEAAGL